jgi:hypothetical protein
MHCKDPWIGVNGQSHKGLCVQFWLSFQDCINLHKLTVFPADAAEKQRFYMQQTIKKPQRVTVHQYMSHMGFLNDYLAYLPTVYDSSMAVEGTKKSDVQFDEADLARIILNLVQVIWMNQYNMTHSTLPKSPRVLLLDLEAIKRIMNEKHQARLKLKAKAKEASSASTSAKGSSKKLSMSGNPSEQVPKKARPANFCQHCKSKGGPHLTHKTNKCCKYNKDGYTVAAATGKPSEVKKFFKKGGDKEIAFPMVIIEYLVKKGLKKAAKSKNQKHRFYDSSSSDSDSDRKLGAVTQR